MVKVCALLGSGKEKIGSISCGDADDAGKCVKMKRTQSSKVAFGFILKGNTWILNTASHGLMSSASSRPRPAQVVEALWKGRSGWRSAGGRTGGGSRRGRCCTRR
ncbi:hypothetical protein D187_008822 [Cystobacter fuscus DSM 2262]|uniref:Uncharacterized protein n=1 Tax=Cystobacter fuscus (strain ATCC 25194 / DSM 2262 / NBRC 100088 / M29) TaxID=1242864 RepID=S9QN11_CYSF2|nr:hypothetical protein D187_008822 [Cystobacter fuscus DSM 2262]